MQEYGIRVQHIIICSAESDIRKYILQRKGIIIIVLLYKEKYFEVKSMKKGINPSEIIIEILEQKDISQSELSKRTGIPTSTISDWKRKGNIPTADKIGLVCEALHVQPEDIIGKANGTEENRRVVYKNEPLWDFISLYDLLEDEQKNRLLKYVMTILKVEQ